VPVRGELRARLLKRLGALVLIVLILPVLIRLVQERLMPLRQLGGN
jgi:ABC-type phosphate transport system permease subunit